MFSGFYLALLLVLVLLIVRVVSFEWREKSESPRWRARLALGERGRQHRARRWSGASRSPTCSTACRSTRTATTRATSGTSSARYTVLGGHRGRAALRVPRRDLPDAADDAATSASARRGAARRLALPARRLRRGFLVWTVVVAVDHNDKDVFPPVLPAASASRRCVLAVALLATRRRSGWAFAMTALGTIALVVATLFTSLYPRVMVSSPTSATASPSRTPPRRTTRSR